MPGVFAKSTRAVKAGVLACLASNQQFYAHMPVVHKLPAVALAMPAAATAAAAAVLVAPDVAARAFRAAPARVEPVDGVDIDLVDSD